MKIVNISQMQKAEQDSMQYGISVDKLMENAGKAAAEIIRTLTGDIRKQNILILIGPGNNGGDGLVSARYLHDWGAKVNVYLCGGRPDKDPNLALVQKRSISLLNSSIDINNNHFIEWLLESNLILDSIFGTGKSRAISGEYAHILSLISEARSKMPGLKIIALDLPSGLNADTGEVDTATPYVDNTITFGFPKVGLFNLPGAERAGEISIVDIGIPPRVVDYVNTDLLTDQEIKLILPKRPLVSNKGTYGKILALVGSINYTGAAYLACSGSIRGGAGLTTLAIGRSLLPILASKLTEITYLPLPELNQEIDPENSFLLLEQYIPRYDVFLVGCGISQSKVTIDLIKKLMINSQNKLPPVILDADGLNILAKVQDWCSVFKNDAILTPHAGEMAKLLGKSIVEIQNNRIDVTRETAIKWHKTVVLKGAYTVIASIDGRVRVSPFANPGLSSAGTGDVLAGTIAGMVAQGLTLFDAASCGVYLHGLAANMVKSELGDSGMLASDLLPMLPRAIRHLKEV
jgi:ADP-dependent NAD(P)H-hydrate dehydratase / NAD(P)H-hydrate epimerase